MDKRTLTYSFNGLLLLLSRFSRVRLCATAARQAPVPGILQARILEWVAISFCNACMLATMGYYTVTKIIQMCQRE